MFPSRELTELNLPQSKREKNVSAGFTSNIINHRCVYVYVCVCVCVFSFERKCMQGAEGEGERENLKQASCPVWSPRWGLMQGLVP